MEEDVIELAKRSGMNYISFTNHDAFTDLSAVSKIASEVGINLIDGIEISSRDNTRGRRVHILCYMPYCKDQIEEVCSLTIQNRLNAGIEMTERVSRLFPITKEDVERIACHSACIYKQHISRALMNAGFTTQIFGDLYNELFSFDRGTCIVNCKSPDVYKVLEIAKRSGGAVVLAHPYTYDSIDLMHELIEQGYLDGIEVWSSKSSPEQEKYLLSVAEKNSLIPTGGSDFHGAYSSRISPIGKKPTPENSIKALFSIVKSRVREGKK